MTQEEYDKMLAVAQALLFNPFIYYCLFAIVIHKKSLPRITRRRLQSSFTFN